MGVLLIEDALPPFRDAGLNDPTHRFSLILAPLRSAIVGIQPSFERIAYYEV